MKMLKPMERDASSSKRTSAQRRRRERQEHAALYPTERRKSAHNDRSRQEMNGPIASAFRRDKRIDANEADGFIGTHDVGPAANCAAG